MRDWIILSDITPEDHPPFAHWQAFTRTLRKSRHIVERITEPPYRPSVCFDAVQAVMTADEIQQMQGPSWVNPASQLSHYVWRAWKIYCDLNNVEWFLMRRNYAGIPCSKKVV